MQPGPPEGLSAKLIQVIFGKEALVADIHLCPQSGLWTGFGSDGVKGQPVGSEEEVRRSHLLIYSFNQYSLSSRLGTGNQR